MCQDKNKYQSPKYRLVVRFTNKFVICQVVYSLVDGDRVLCHANSKELERYGLKVGLKNYAAAYCTGLLVARRLLQKVGLDDVYEGNTEVDGQVVTSEYDKKKYYVDEVDEDKRPFRCLLDVGCRPTTTGCRIFGALKVSFGFYVTVAGADMASHSLRQHRGLQMEVLTFRTITNAFLDTIVPLRSMMLICTVNASLVSPPTFGLNFAWSRCRELIKCPNRCLVQ